jgi:segregation and condensation protein A
MSEATLFPPQADGTPSGHADAGPSRPGEVRLDAFQGPLELLLHLIRIEEIDVTTLPIADIARQYNDYLGLTHEVEPETAGEHVVGVATLIHMKSRRLLPADPAAVASEAPVSLQEQSHFDRAARAEALRGVAEHLQEREAVMELVYFRPVAAIAEYAGEKELDADLFALLRAFREILRRVGKDEIAHISRERITLVERINWLMDTMQNERRVQFRTLFSGLADRVACILTFLALLEVIRLRLVRAHMSHHHEDILILLADEPIAPRTEPENPHA